MKKWLFAAAACIALYGAVQPAFAQQAGELPGLTSKAYASMKQDDVYLIMFTAPYCGPCRNAKKELFPKLMKKYAAFTNVHFYELDIEKDQPAPDGSFLKDRWAVDGLPMFVVVSNDAVMFSAKGYSSSISQRLQISIENKINALK